MTKKDIIFYKAWKEIVELIGLTFSAIVVFKNGLNILSIFFGFFIVASIVISVYSIYKQHQELNANAYRSKTDINKYMSNWLKSNNRSIIFSRDMSWADNDDYIKQILRKKATDQELTLILSRRTKLVEELERLGASFIEYGYLGYTPDTRFTFVNYESMDVKVAIGKKDKFGVHRINEYTHSDAPTYFLANDIVSLLEKVDEYRVRNEKNDI